MSDALPPPRSSPEPIEELARLAGERVAQNEALSRKQRSSSIGGERDVVEGEGERTQSKQRRKRTTPQDQAKLESEYKLNPKPNKAARAEIVKSVSLNEKEVQIWFQNRRQINRRKSRPLLPHEIAAFGLGGMPALSSDPVSSPSSGPEAEEDGKRSTQEGEDSHEEMASHALEVLKPRSAEEPEQIDPELEVIPSSQIDPEMQGNLKDEADMTVKALSNPNSSSSDNVSKSFSSTPGYLANRWNTMHSSFSSPSASQAPAATTPPVAGPSQPSSCPERLEGPQRTPSSRVRLSMSLNGKAELIEGESSPSPPRAIAPRPSSSSSFIQRNKRTFHRSQSALPLTFPRPDTSPLIPFAPQMPSGRSRDARTWEFCCDVDAQDELTTQAESETTGSAVAAISLLRSLSNSGPKTSGNKRNAPNTKRDGNMVGKRLKLGRSTSSLPRLQNTSSTKDIRTERELHEKDLQKKDPLLRSPSGDSDKENWVPSENGVATSRRRPLPSGKTTKTLPRAVLGDNTNVPTHAVNFGGPEKRSRKNKTKNIAIDILEDQENVPNQGGEVEKFMRGAVSPSKKGDLDCVQGLLSLSQGNWAR